MVVFRLQVALAVFALCGVVVPALAAEPLLPDAYPGAELVFSADEPTSFVEIALGPIVRRSRAIAMSSHKMSGMRGYYGTLARRHYKVADEVSTSEVLSHYSEWLEANGFATLLDAYGDSPMAPGGTSWALRAYGDLPTEIVTELSGTADKSRRRYLVAEKDGGGEHAVTTVLVNPRRSGELRLHVEVLSVDSAKTAKAFPSRAQLYDRLTTDGRIYVGGIQYVGKMAVPRDSCDALLADVAAMLAQHRELRLAVVARVTVEGSEQAATDLALARANAVKDMLILEHGVAPVQIEARAAEYATESGSVADQPEVVGGSVAVSPAPDGIEFLLRR